MTNAEAVNWLINITADIGKAEHSDLWHYEQALSEIREMLEDAHTETHDNRTETHACDLVDRQAAIDALGDMVMNWTDSDYELGQLNQWKEDRKAIIDLPSAQPQWIPVTERLPEEDVEVLITYRYKEGEGDTSHAYIDITTYGQMYFGGNKVGDHKHWRQPFEYFTSNYEVVAWMPLPEPYKEEQNGKNS